MTLEIPAALLVFGELATIAALVASTVAYFKAKLSKDTIDLLKENNAALSARVDVLTERVDVLTKENEQLRAENQTLRSIASADRAIKDLADVVSAGHKDILAAIAAGTKPSA